MKNINWNNLYNTIHKWVGLSISLWLLVLSITGFMLANRDWRWQWDNGPNLPKYAMKHGAGNDKYMWRHYQADPKNPKTAFTGGATGAYLTRNGGKSWDKIAFDGFTSIDVKALETTKIGEFGVYAGTNEGLFIYDKTINKFRQIGLDKLSISSVSASRDEIVAVVDNSQLFKAKLANNIPLQFGEIDLGMKMPKSKMPAKVDLGIYLQDIHVGRGLFNITLDKFIQNFSALGLAFLSLSGVLYWLFMRRILKNKDMPKEKKLTKEKFLQIQKVTKWIFRTHASIIGLVIAIPLLLIFVSGIYQDHRKDVQMAFRKIIVPNYLLTPTYHSQSWKNAIYSVAIDDTNPQKGISYLIGTKKGVFASIDGAKWEKEKGFMGPAMRMRSLGDSIIVPGRMMRRVQVRENGAWRVLNVDKEAVMANEMTRLDNNTILWQRGMKIIVTDAAGGKISEMKHSPPRLSYAPWALIADGIHEGVIFSEHWKWINDIVALGGIILVITGFLRWLRRKW